MKNKTNLIVCLKLTLVSFLLTPAFLAAKSPQPISVSIPTVTYIDATYSKALSSEKSSTLKEKFSESFTLSKAIGLNTCIYLPDEGLWKSALGVENTTDNTPILPTSKFHAGSIGKMITATLILRLIEKEKFSLDTKINRWFKDTKYAEAISIYDLLNHKSGLPGNFEKNISDQTLLEKANSTLSNKPLFIPGTAFSYSNPGYIILGLILEQEHKKSLAQLIESDFIQHLSLEESIALTADNTEKALIISKSNIDHEISNEDNEIDFSSIGGAGILATTPCDLVRSLNALLARKIVNETSIKKMTEIAYPMNHEATLHWTQGLMLLDTPLGRVHFLNGRIGGYGASVIYHKELNVFVSVMLTGGNQNQVGPILFHLLKTVKDFK